MFTKGTLILLCLIVILNIHQSVNLCIQREKRALLKIEEDIYDPYDWLSSWRGEGRDCCNWQGITCHNTTGHVISLDLNLPTDSSFNYNEMSNKSKLNPSLVDLKHLTYLDLSFSNFFGAPVPTFIGSLVHLQYLDLSYSGFEGTIPAQLGNLSNLQVLRIDNSNEYNVPIKLRVDDLHWLSRLTSLTYLQMRSVNLSTAVDWFGDITKLPSINTIFLDKCSLPGIPRTMPPLNNFTFLQYLNLDGSGQNSTIASWLFNNITNLEFLSLADCGLYGGLPLLSGQVSNLKTLNLPYNNFYGDVIQHLNRLPLLEELYLMDNNINSSISEILQKLGDLKHHTSPEILFNHIHGSVPNSVGNYSQLKTLDISMNYITGEIPHSIGNLFKLVNLALSNNNLEGKIPESIGNLKKLQYYDVAKNGFSGEIPHSLFNLSYLTYLSLANNNFSGEVPKSINLSNVGYVDLSNNRLSGSIFFTNQSLLAILNLSNNSFTGMFPFSGRITSRLQVVNLSNNSFSGIIPNLFMFLPSLNSLQLDKNRFNGLIPSSLKHCKLLSFLDFSENKLCGKIPPWMGSTLLALKVLNLRSNNFVGQIPKELSCLTSLQILDLSHNHLTGNFSLYFDNFTVMTEARKTKAVDFNLNIVSQFTYPENIWLNKQGIARQYTTTIAYAIYIDVSSNDISGEIPNGITKLVGLKLLNMSRNHFIGNIPTNIRAIKDLEELDLSSNELSGEIPSTMAQMSYLRFLNLSYNKLSGMIPAGNQFQTFIDPSIYSGNSNLCGWPLPKCSGSKGNNTDIDSEESKEHDYWYEKTWVNAGTVVGFLISSWSTFLMLLINNSIRRLYFYYVDKLYDSISLHVYIGIRRLSQKL